MNEVFEKERFWTIPNLLSAYRILIFPYLLYLVFQEQRSLFTIMLGISLVTDVLDGFIARQFRLETRLGARLDSWADYGSYFLALAGLIVFEWDYLWMHRWGFGLYFILFCGSLAANFIRFGKIVGLHLYSAKIAGYLQAFFMLSLLAFGPAEWLYWLMLIAGILTELEQIAVLYLLKEARSNAKGLYWVIKNP